MKKKLLPIVKNDPCLEPYADIIEGRHQDVVRKEAELTNNGAMTLQDFANGHKYYGLHRTTKGWVFREWAPHAVKIYLVGTFSDWEEREEYALTAIGNGTWEITLPKSALRHGDLYKLQMQWNR